MDVSDGTQPTLLDRTGVAHVFLRGHGRLIYSFLSSQQKDISFSVYSELLDFIGTLAVSS